MLKQQVNQTTHDDDELESDVKKIHSRFQTAYSSIVSLVLPPGEIKIRSIILLLYYKIFLSLELGKILQNRQCPAR